VVVQAPLTGVIGFVVAGGRSTRMGRDKALLPWDGGTLLDHAIARLNAVCADVRILCGPEPRYADRGLPLVLDPPRDGAPGREAAGPLAGLAAGLDSAGEAAGLYLGVDLPHIPRALLAALVATDPAADAVVPVTPRGPEPLCAVYRPGCAAAVRARLAAGDHRMTSFWPDIRVHEMKTAALATFGDPDHLFRNVNAPADYRAARDQL
jgi:molybdopterin-guanine dinucleotide biosynthesis protein A